MNTVGLRDIKLPPPVDGVNSHDESILGQTIQGVGHEPGAEAGRLMILSQLRHKRESEPANGYAHAFYAGSFHEFGAGLELPSCGGWLIKRPITGSTDFDAIGAYPLFACRDWNHLGDDLRILDDQLVSVALVTDPFGNFKPEELNRTFDVAFHFKDHYICDLAQDPKRFVSSHHRYYARRALKRVDVDLVENPNSCLEEWLAFYKVLIRRHELSGIKAFSRDCFIRQLNIPGLIMMRVSAGGTPMGFLLWYIDRGVAYAHLMAICEEGYALNAFYALLWRSIEHFKNSPKLGISYLHLGGSSGTSGSAAGILFFKKGWSTGTLPAWFCGKILNHTKYNALAANRATVKEGYFPAYRSGEF